VEDWSTILGRGIEGRLGGAVCDRIPCSYGSPVKPMMEASRLPCTRSATLHIKQMKKSKDKSGENKRGEEKRRYKEQVVERRNGRRCR
jgi:hypothetical protein